VLPVHFDAAPMSDEMSLKRAEEACAKLREYSIGEKFELTVFPFCEARIEIVDRAPDNLTCVLCKRGMLKVAEKFAIENRCQGIVTGENLGQVASQTLLNLSTITYGFRLPILRPLITYDKNEIVNLSRKISTYKISIQDALCCTARPLHPATSSNIDRILEVEKEIDFEKILRKVYRGAKRIK
ncbi:MAG: tRNA 4-thiouridine(8) synthase ThiI, partial [Candidatus Hydrothermarchaeaceae archaeon]